MPDDTLRLDQPEQHVYEPPHWWNDSPMRIDAGWLTRPGNQQHLHPRVVATVYIEKREFDITLLSCESLDAGEAMKIAHWLADAVRWVTGEIEKLNTPPAPHGGGTSQDASGGQSSP